MKKGVTLRTWRPFQEAEAQSLAGAAGSNQCWLISGTARTAADTHKQISMHLRGWCSKHSPWKAKTISTACFKACHSVIRTLCRDNHSDRHDIPQ
eukprot:scaffold322427_cov19-Tisochrysis_lutea.AAC.4